MNLTERLTESLQTLFLALFAILGLALGNALLNPAATHHERTGTVEIHSLDPATSSAP